MITPSDGEREVTFRRPPVVRSGRAQTLELIAGSFWFLLLGLLVLSGVWTEAQSTDWRQSGFHAWTHFLSRAFVAVYYVLLWLLILLRPAPVKTAESRFQTAVAFLGTYLPLAVPFIARTTGSGALRIVSALLLSPWTVALLVVHSAIQVRRTFHEEAVLLTAFPDYRAYAAKAARIIPGVW